MTLIRTMLIAVLGGGLALVAACSDGGGGGNGTGGGTGGGGGGDSGAEAAASEGGGTHTKANGEACAGDGDCISDHCKTQGAGGGGGGTAGSFCTIFCAVPSQSPAPECAAPVFTGKCSGASFCQVK